MSPRDRSRTLHYGEVPVAEPRPCLSDYGGDHDRSLSHRRRHPLGVVWPLPRESGGRRARPGLGRVLPRRAPRPRGERGVAGPAGARRAVHPDASRRSRPGPVARGDQAGRGRPVDLHRRGVRRPLPDLAQRRGQEDRRRSGPGRPGQRHRRGRRGARPGRQDRAGRRAGPGTRGRGRPARRAPVAVRPGLPRAGPGGAALGAPGPPAGDHHPVVRDLGGPSAGPVLRLVRVLPALGGRRDRPGRDADQARHLRHRRRAGCRPSPR